MFRSRAERKVAEAGYDPARLPPGQYLTEKWPVLHAGDVPYYPADLAGWDFRVHGEVETPLTLDVGRARRAAEGDRHAGHPLRHPLEPVRRDVHRRPVVGDPRARRPRESAHYAIAHAEAGFTANVPASFLEPRARCSSTHADGEPLAPEHGWPLRLVVPGKYFWKSAKWLRAIELRATDAPGFWERYGYHNDADPWKEQRYAF